MGEEGGKMRVGILLATEVFLLQCLTYHWMMLDDIFEVILSLLSEILRQGCIAPTLTGGT